MRLVHSFQAGQGYVDPYPGYNNTSYDVDYSFYDLQYFLTQLVFARDEIYRVDQSGNRTLLTIPTDTFEIYANVFHSLTRAIGTMTLQGVPNGKQVFDDFVDLHDLYGFDARNSEHSGQFHFSLANPYDGRYPNVAGYWKEVYDAVKNP